MNLGSVSTGSTVRIPFNTFSGVGASTTVTNLAAGDVKIHKDGSATERASANGVTVSIDFDSITGNHYIIIDLSDDTDAGFYSADSVYDVRLEGITVDSQTLNLWVGRFRISAKPHVDDLNDLGSSDITAAAPTTAQITAAIEAIVVDDGGASDKTLLGLCKDLVAYILGDKTKSSTNHTYKDIGGNTRYTAVVDSDGNRTMSTRTLD